MTNQDVKQISIRLLPDGFSFSGQTKHVSPGADYEKRLEEALLDADVMQENADEVICIVEGFRFILSPATCSISEAEQMYKLSLPDVDNEVLINQTDKYENIRITFGLNAEICHFMRRNIPGIVFNHPLMEIHNAWSHKVETDNNYMIAQADGSILDLVVYKNGKLFMANRFASTSNDNTLYFVMNMWTQCQLDVLEDKIYLECHSDELRQTISKYIKQCE